MAIGAPHVTFLDLHDYAFPADALQQVRHVEGLLAPHVVKLQHVSVGFPAIDTGVVTKIEEYPGSGNPMTLGIPNQRLGDVVGPVAPVMVSLICAVAEPAHALVPGRPVPGEIPEGQVQAAAAAPLGVHPPILSNGRSLRHGPVHAKKEACRYGGPPSPAVDTRAV
jgi:hypothetical protein